MIQHIQIAPAFPFNRYFHTKAVSGGDEQWEFLSKPYSYSYLLTTIDKVPSSVFLPAYYKYYLGGFCYAEL